jgi:ADP-dependent NAD(P)H-hydrate dehydratase / NAD(P)H-hydrate epimerase
MISLLSCSLLSAEDSRVLDREAQDEWGFNVFSLIETAGRLSAEVFVRHFGELFENNPKITVLSGTGNNGADAMVMLRSWILSGLAEASNCTLVVSRLPKSGEACPWTEMLKSLEKMKVPVFAWNGETGKDSIGNSDIIIDGIAGTGISGPLRGAAQEMVHAINSQKTKKPFVVSVDIPSGNSDEWKPGMPIVGADFTLAIEPQKGCIYNPAARPYAGIVLPVNGIFPKEIIDRYRGAELLDWESVRLRVPKVKAYAHKYERGCVEIRAGSAGTTGAALIAARGAQAAGAGLVRLVADDDIYPILASGTGGIMVSPVSGKFQDFEGKFTPDAILLGPGWGRGDDRAPVLEKALQKEKAGTPLILDADAIDLSKDLSKNAKFSGNAILTPHPGELSRFSGIEKEDLLCRPAPALLKLSREVNAVFLFKSHVLFIAAPDGRLGIIDGMAANLAAGGSGDLLAGICAAIAARTAREGGFDAYNCAAAAAGLLIASAKADNLRKRFTDPLELADKAADLAGEAWLI